MTTNQIAYHKMMEDRFHNRNMEEENRRHNKQTEAASFDANDARRDVQQMKSQDAANKLAEDMRHNKVGEAHNTVKLGVDAADKAVNAGIKIAGLALGGTKLSKINKY